MKITKIAKQEKRDRYNLFGPLGFIGALAADVLASSGLREGDELTSERLEQLLQRDHYGKVLAKAYDYLSRRPHSQQEIRTKLRRKECEPALIEEVIEHLASLGYLDDVDFARRWVALRGESRGPRLLRVELRQKGIPADLIEQALATRSTDDDYRVATELVAKKLKSISGQPWEKAYPKLSGLLARRGYDYDTVRSVLDQVRPKA